MEKHVTNGQQKSSEAKGKRTRGWEFSLVLRSCDLTRKMDELQEKKFLAHLLVFLHSELGPHKIAANKKGVGEKLKDVGSAGKC